MKMGRRRQSLILLFVCGLTIGFLLEILIFERHRFRSLGHATDPQVSSVKLTCLVLVKRKHFRYVTASVNTWLKGCDDRIAVKVYRHGTETTPPQTRSGSCGDDDDDDCSQSSVSVRHVTAKSGWGGLCKGLLGVRHDPSRWLLIMPDSLAVLVENLALFVQNLKPENRHYYGYGVRDRNTDYNVLSAGILLSGGALTDLLGNFQTEKDCDDSGKHWRNEDLYLGMHLKDLGIFPADTRDEQGRGRFHGYNFNNLIWPGKLFEQSDYKRKALYPVPKGFNCCSPHLITFDTSDSDMMTKTYFFLRGLSLGNESSPTPPQPHDQTQPRSFFWKDFLRERGYDEESIEGMTQEEYQAIWERILPLETMYREMRETVRRPGPGER